MVSKLEIKEYAQIIENELAQKIGFVIPKENIIVSNHQKNWTYLPESRSIIAPDILQTNDNKAEIDFSVAHEFAHMIQNFIFSSKIKLENITKEKYEKEINAFLVLIT